MHAYQENQRNLSRLLESHAAPSVYQDKTEKPDSAATVHFSKWHVTSPVNQGNAEKPSQRSRNDISRYPHTKEDHKNLFKSPEIARGFNHRLTQFAKTPPELLNSAFSEMACQFFVKKKVKESHTASTADQGKSENPEEGLGSPRLLQKVSSRFD